MPEDKKQQTSTEAGRKKGKKAKRRAAALPSEKSVHCKGSGSVEFPWRRQAHSSSRDRQVGDFDH